MSEDTQCTVVVFSITCKEGGVPYILYIEDGYGPESIKEFKFPVYWYEFKNWNVIKRRNFMDLMQKGEMINITFDKDYRLLEISSTDEEKPQGYLIAHDPVDYFSVGVEKESPHVNTTTTCTTTTTQNENRRKQKTLYAEGEI